MRYAIWQSRCQVCGKLWQPVAPFYACGRMVSYPPVDTLRCYACQLAALPDEAARAELRKKYRIWWKLASVLSLPCPPELAP